MQTNADVRKCRSKNCAPTPAKNKPERPEKLRAVLFHFFLLLTASNPVTNVDQFLGIYFVWYRLSIDFAVPHPDTGPGLKLKRSSYPKDKETKRFIRTSFSW